MSIRVKKYLNDTGSGSEANVAQTAYKDSSVIETTVDGQTFAWGPNQVRNFLDDGVGLAHANFRSAGEGVDFEDTVIEDNQPFNNSRA